MVVLLEIRGLLPSPAIPNYVISMFYSMPKRILGRASERTVRAMIIMSWSSLRTPSSRYDTKQEREGERVIVHM